MSLAQKPWGLILLSVLCVLTGLSFQAIIMACNYLQGMSIGPDNASHAIFAGFAVLIDVGFIILSVVRGYHLRIGERWAARKCGFWAFLCGSISLAMFCGYGAANRIEPTRQAQLEYKAALDATQQSNALSAAATAQLQAHLEKQDDKAGDEARRKGLNNDQRSVAATEQKTILDTMKQLTKVEIKAAPVEKTPDAWAAAMSRLSGLDVSTIQTLLLVVMGIGAIFMSSFMIRKGVMIYPTPPVSAPAVPSAMDRELPANVEKLLSAPEQVRKFFRENTRSNPDAEVVAADMHRAYAEWAASKHYRPILSSQGFGVAANNLRVAGEIDIGRHHRGGNVRYTGRVPFNLKTEPRAPTVKRGIGRPKVQPVAPMRLASSGIVH